MTSYIYFIQVDGGGPIKIGITKNDPRKRMSKIQSDCPWPVSLLGATTGALDDEAAFHRNLSAFKMQGEWFKPAPEVLAAIGETLRTTEVSFKPKKRGPKYAHPLCEYRSQHGLTLKDIASRVGVEHATISRIESGKLNPSIDLVARIVEATGIHGGDLRPDLYRIFYPEQARERELARAAQ